MSKKRRKITQYEMRNPDKILSNLINDYVEGVFDDYRWLHRAVVLRIDYIGGQFETNPDNPKGSIIARRVSDGADRYTSNEDLGTYYPFFPFGLSPVKEGEHVYVMFEDEDEEHGLWITRIPEPKNVDSKNITPGVAKFIHFSRDGRVNDNNAEAIVQGSDEAVPRIVPSPEFITEPVFDFNSRIGDYTIQGSNNTLINLGRDRVSTTDTGLTAGAGTIDVVTGRTSENVDLVNDKSRILVSSNTAADANFAVAAGQDSGQGATIVIKSDQIRIIARQGTKIVNEGGEIVIQTPGNVTIEGANINIGLNADQAAVLGNNLQTYIDNFINSIFNTHTHPTAMGPSGPSITPGVALSPNVLSQTVKVKP